MTGLQVTEHQGPEVKMLRAKTCEKCSNVPEDALCAGKVPRYRELVSQRERPDEGDYRAFSPEKIHIIFQDDPDVDCNDWDCSDLCAHENMKCLGDAPNQAMGFPFDRPFLKKLGSLNINSIFDFVKVLPNAALQEIR
ncbi:unnamed protein product, partial [Meganyctiphanes norvegica]